MLALLTCPEWDSRTAAVYTAACVFANGTKPYINLLWVVLPLVVVRKNEWKARLNRAWYTVGTLAGALLLTQIVEQYGTMLRHNYGTIARQGGSTVNGGAQLLFVLKNPLRYIAVLLGTLYENDGFLGQLGLFGWKDMPVAFLNLTGPMVLLAAALLCAPKTNALGRRRNGWLSVFAAVYAVGAMTAMYITYTPVGMVRIVGLQTRYFLPVWLLLAVGVAALIRRALKPALTAERGEALALPLCGWYAFAGAVLLFQHYFIGICLRHLSITTGGDLYCADLGLGGCSCWFCWRVPVRCWPPFLDCDAALLPLPLLSAAALVLYPFGMLGNLRIGAAAAVLLLGAAVVVGVVRLRPAGVGTAVKTALTRPGFALFLGGAAFIWCLFALHRPMFTQWDEFTAWGLAPKMVVERAAFYVADPVNLKASFTYPATSLVTFLFQPFGSWAEWACLAALDTLALACVAAASALPRPQWAGGHPCVRGRVCAAVLLLQQSGGQLCAAVCQRHGDLPLAMLFGGALCLYYSIGHRRRAFWLTGLPLMLLTLTKDICFAYGLIAAFLIGLDQLVTADKPINQSFPRAFLRAGGLAVCVVAAFVSWSRYTAAVTPHGGHRRQRGQRGLKLRRGADRRRQAAAGHWPR